MLASDSKDFKDSHLLVVVNLDLGRGFLEKNITRLCEMYAMKRMKRGHPKVESYFPTARGKIMGDLLVCGSVKF